MKRSRSRNKKQASKIKRQHTPKQRIRKMRGKYRHLNRMRGLVEARKEERQPKNALRRLGTLKGRMKIKGDIIHSDIEGDWEVQ